MTTTQSCQYKFPKIDPRWADRRATSYEVAQAIHAISSRKRTPAAIWAAPTQAECDHVAMALNEYIRCGLIERATDGRYHWGLETVTVDGSAQS